jgi:hypothetical protein
MRTSLVSSEKPGFFTFASLFFSTPFPSSFFTPVDKKLHQTIEDIKLDEHTKISQVASGPTVSAVSYYVAVVIKREQVPLKQAHRCLLLQDRPYARGNRKLTRSSFFFHISVHSPVIKSTKQ